MLFGLLVTNKTKKLEMMCCVSFHIRNDTNDTVSFILNVVLKKLLDRLRLGMPHLAKRHWFSSLWWLYYSFFEFLFYFFIFLFYFLFIIFTFIFVFLYIFNFLILLYAYKSKSHYMQNFIFLFVTAFETLTNPLRD